MQANAAARSLSASGGLSHMQDYPVRLHMDAYLDELGRDFAAEQILSRQLAPEGLQRGGHAGCGGRAVGDQLPQMLPLQHLVGVGAQALHLLPQPAAQGVPVWTSAGEPLHGGQLPACCRRPQLWCQEHLRQPGRPAMLAESSHNAVTEKKEQRSALRNEAVIPLPGYAVMPPTPAQ